MVPMKIPDLIQATLAFVLVGLFGCASPGASSADMQPGASTSKKAGPQRAVEKKERELRYARIELELLDSKLQADSSASELQVESAQRAVEDASTALDRFEKLEQPLHEAESELSLDRSKRRVIEERQNLEGIRRIYADEVEAEAEAIVIERHVRNVEFAERGLAIAEQRQHLSLENEIRSKERKLRWAVREASAKLRKTQQDAERARSKSELEMMKKNDAVSELQRELDDLNKKQGAGAGSKS